MSGAVTGVVEVVDTPHGPAQVRHHRVARPWATLLLGHGAGGTVDALDLGVVTDVAVALGIDVALMTQPYRVAGRRAPAPAGQLDVCWSIVAATLAPDRPLVVGGRSSGARVACRTSAAVNARAVLCLAFPEHPPGKPERSRMPELDAVTVPVLVVQGERDRMGCPAPGRGREVVVLAGDHALTADLPGIAAAVGPWLTGLLRAS